jgi:hypothetical protein
MDRFRVVFYAPSGKTRGQPLHTCNSRNSMAMRMSGVCVAVVVRMDVNVNVGPGIVLLLLFRRVASVRMRHRRQLAGDESKQHEG